MDPGAPSRLDPVRCWYYAGCGLLTTLGGWPAAISHCRTSSASVVPGAQEHGGDDLFDEWSIDQRGRRDKGVPTGRSNQEVVEGGE